MQTAIIIAVGVIAIIGVNVWADGLHRERNMAATLYEQCVQAEYGMTPIQWYEQNGKYPRCGN